MREPERHGDFLVFPAFAKGGTASVHLGRLVRSAGFKRLVVIKRLHPEYAAETDSAQRLLPEAHLASRVLSP